MSEILYLKIDRNHQVDHVDVRLGDIAKLECTDLNKKNRLKTLKLLKIQAEKSDRYIFSIMKVVELIHRSIRILRSRTWERPILLLNMNRRSIRMTGWHG